MKEILRKNGLDIGGVRKPLASIIGEDMPKIEECRKMIEEGHRGAVRDKLRRLKCSGADVFSSGCYIMLSQQRSFVRSTASLQATKYRQCIKYFQEKGISYDGLAFLFYINQNPEIISYKKYTRNKGRD